MTEKEALQYIPLNGNLLVKDDPEPEKSKGGIILPGSDTKLAITRTGVVLKSSAIRLSDGKIIPADVKAGDRVLYNFLAGIKGMSEKAEDGSYYRIIEHNTIIAKVECTE